MPWKHYNIANPAVNFYLVWPLIIDSQSLCRVFIFIVVLLGRKFLFSCFSCFSSGNPQLGREEALRSPQWTPSRLLEKHLWKGVKKIRKGKDSCSCVTAWCLGESWYVESTNSQPNGEGPNRELSQAINNLLNISACLKKKTHSLLPTKYFIKVG